MGAPSFALRNATIIDGTEAMPIKGGTIIIKNGKIHAVGAKHEVKIPPDATSIDVRGAFVTPGLIDAHVHFFQSGGIYTRPDILDLRHKRSYDEEIAWIKERLPETLSRYLCSGITAVVDAGGPRWTLAMKQKFKTSNNAPRIAVSGPLLSSLVPDALATKDPANLALNHEANIEQIVKELSREGTDLIKLWLPKTADLPSRWPMVQAAINEAHARGLRVIVHATELETARRAVRLGADILAHSVFDEVVDEEFLSLLKKNQVIYIPTLLVKINYRAVLSGQRPMEGALDQQCGDREVVATWNPLTKSFSQRSQSYLRVAKKNLAMIARAGIKIAAGSDAGNIGTLHGPGLHHELSALVEAGLSPHQALIAATRDAAHVFSKNPRIGVIKKGFRADLLILAANPLDSISNAQKIIGVMKDGVFVKELKLPNNP